jgi:hypothetical protein
MVKRINIKKLSPRNGDILFISALGLNSEEINCLRDRIENDLNEIDKRVSTIICNFDVKVKKINCKGIKKISLSSKDRFDEEYINDILDVVAYQVKHVQEPSTKLKFITKKDNV